MKLWFAVCAAAVFTLLAQNRPVRPVPLKHLAVATPTSLQPVWVTAREIVRELPYNYVDHLSGDVEIKMPVCIVTGPGTTHSCSGYMVLRADRADFHEDSGQIEPSGNVRVTREP
jgi:hypothetical protein